MIHFLYENVLAIVTAIGGFFAWFFERNKRKQEFKIREEAYKEEKIDNDVKIMKLYQEALNDLKKRYREDLEELEQKHNERFTSLETKYNNLKKSFDTYKKNHP